MLYEAFCPSFYCMLITREIVFTKLKMLLDNSGTFLLLHRHVTANSISTAQTRRLGDVNNDDDRYLLISMVANLFMECVIRGRLCSKVSQTSHYRYYGPIPSLKGTEAQRVTEAVQCHQLIRGCAKLKVRTLHLGVYGPNLFTLPPCSSKGH